MTTSAPRVPTSRRRRWLAVLLVVAVCVASVGPVVAAAPSPPRAAGSAALSPATGAAGGERWQQSTPTPAENATTAAGDSVRHRDPRGLSEPGDLTALEATLADALAVRLDGSSAAVDRGEYARARSLLGERYGAVLGRYVRVAGETPGSDDDAERFTTAREEQAAFVEAVTDYRRTRAEYEAAKRAADEERARELARDLDELATEAERRNERLSTVYDAFDAESGRDFSATRRSLANVQRNISAEQAVVREAEFVGTSLAVTGVAGGGSFLDPVVVSGRLVDETGRPLADRSVRVAVNGTDSDVETNASGAFDVVYRPVTDGLGAQTLTVEYVPAPESAYLGSRATATAVVQRSTPTLTVAEATRSASFGDTLAVSGSVAVDGRPAAGVPLVVAVGDVVVARVETDGVGSFRFAGPLPAAVPAGDRRLRVAFPFEGRAFAPVAATAPLAVGATGTELAVDGRQAAIDSLAVSGRLTTADGRPVAGQPVSVVVGASPVGRFETSATGAFDDTVWLPAAAAGRSEVELVVGFDGAGTNLDSARATARVAVAGAGTGAAGTGGAPDASAAAGPVGRALLALVGPAGSVRLFGVSLGGLAASIWFDAAVAAGVLVAVLVVVARRRAVGDAAPTASPAAASDAPAPPAADVAALPRLLVELARDRADHGAVRPAVEYAYLAARLSTAARSGLPNRGTHRQFAAACADALPDGAAAPFRALTDRYERALFGATDPPATDAAAALAEARAVVDAARTTARDSPLAHSGGDGAGDTAPGPTPAGDDD